MALFYDDISLLDSYPSSLRISMDDCSDYSLQWRYEFSPTKTGVVIFGEDKRTHKSQMNEIEWKPGSKKVDD